MITEYYRPKKLDDALKLISRVSPITKPLGGGTIISHEKDSNFAVVDLQDLGLDQVKVKKDGITLGACCTLQQIVNDERLPENLRQVAKLESGINLRNMGTLAGTLKSADGRSMITGLLLCLDASLLLEPEHLRIPVDEYHNNTEKYHSTLITGIHVPLFNDQNAFESIRKTPRDFPLISVFMAIQKDGKLRIVIGGKCDFPFIINENQFLQSNLGQSYMPHNFREISREYFVDAVTHLITRLMEELQ